MSAGKSIADDIIDGLRAVTKKWTSQRKQEERQASARAYRIERLLRSHRETVKDVAWEIMEKAYLTASNNNKLPATARQVMYAARPEIQERTGRRLDDQYFTQTLLPDYIEERGVKWDVVFDDRGHFREPHTKRAIGLGTLKVRQYESEIGDITFSKPSFDRGGISTCGPQGCYGAILFIEKEGFMPLFEAVNLAERFDIALMSTKGVSVTASRHLIDEMCGCHDIPLLVLHDFDKAGFSIVGTLQRDTRRYSFANEIEVIDLGLRLQDIEGLQRALQPRIPAYREAGWETSDDDDAYSNACRLERRAGVRERIEFLSHQAEELIAEKRQRIEEALWNIHGADIGDFFEDVEIDGKITQRPKRLSELDPEIRKNIEKINIDGRGRAVPQLYSKLAASQELRRMLNIGKSDDQQAVYRLSDAELVSQLADMAKQLGIDINLNYSFAQQSGVTEPEDK